MFLFSTGFRFVLFLRILFFFVCGVVSEAVVSVALASLELTKTYLPLPVSPGIKGVCCHTRPDPWRLGSSSSSSSIFLSPRTPNTPQHLLFSRPCASMHPSLVIGRACASLCRQGHLLLLIGVIYVGSQGGYSIIKGDAGGYCSRQLRGISLYLHSACTALLL